MARYLSLSRLLENGKFPKGDKGKEFAESLRHLQERMLRVQQGLYHQKGRAILAFEGFDAAGKGGVIRRLTALLDPRGFQVHPIGPPDPREQGRHWLYRFWTKLPEPGHIAVFDRTWYGRVLVERAEKLTKRANWERAYDEINQFEAMLANDGVTIVKIFLAVSRDEQLKRFEDRQKDPYRRWKLTMDDLHAREKWNEYVEATDVLFKKTHSKLAPWHLIPSNHKHYAQEESLKLVTNRLKVYAEWMEHQAETSEYESLEEAMHRLSEENNQLS